MNLRASTGLEGGIDVVCIGNDIVDIIAHAANLRMYPWSSCRLVTLIVVIHRRESKNFFSNIMKFRFVIDAKLRPSG